MEAPPIPTYRGKYQCRISDLKPWVGSCPSCNGPVARLHLDVDPELLSSGHRLAANREEIAGYGRYLSPHPCSSCELKQIIAGLFPAPPVAIESPADQELRRLRQELATRDAPEAPADAAAGPLGLFPAGRLYVTVAAGRALYRAGTGRIDEGIGPLQWTPFVGPLLARHVAGDFGLCGRHADGDVEAGAGMNPLASQVDRNVAAIAEGVGSVRSVYQVERRETRRTGELGTRSEVLAERVEIGCRTELAIGLTAVGLVNEIMGQT